ncbi:MAG: nicotinate-nucleotide--dimethylbenzimidazole phosphoribosyltransferase [Frankiales bacterium]|nr:nicotinate-nucleotide--dimethylbenzimidazole phosphoribosyltransferase [Frankiales bacterium]
MYDDDWLRQLCGQVGELDAGALGDALQRQDRLTKPRGALGELERVSAQLAGISGLCPPPAPARPVVVVFAGDHGVHAQGVSPWPQEVTAQMLATVLAGGAAVSVLADEVGAELWVVDVGVSADLDPHPQLRDCKVANGTRDLSAEPAMTIEQAMSALAVGAELAVELAEDGNDLLVTGDMGIANTTPSAALIAALTGSAAAEVTGRGTGIDDETWRTKVGVVERALAMHHVDRAHPLEAAAAVGGLEHLALAGFILGGASVRVPVLLDGVISGSAALLAQALAPGAIDFCIAGHRSAEPGHAIALEWLGLTPLLDLGMRLGEGSGALLALPVVRSAARLLQDMATFDSAGVTDKAAPATG